MSSKLQVDIVTDARGVGPGLDAAESRFQRFGSKAAKYGKMAALGIAAVGAAGFVVGKKLWEMGDAADDSNARIRQIAGSMDLFGNKVDKVTGRLIKYAERTARQTGLDTNQVKATQAKLLTFGALAESADKVGGNFDRATRAAIDLAATGFGTAEGNAAQLGKAMQDPVKGLAALAKSGVTFTQVEKDRIATLVESNRVGAAQSLVLSAIEKQVGGVAAAQAGGLDRLRVTATQLAEKVGMRLVPVVDQFSDWLLDKGLPATKRMAGELRERFGPSLARIGTFITERVIPGARQFYAWFVDKIVPGIVKFVRPQIEAMGRTVDKVRDALKRNEPELRDTGDLLKRVGEFIGDKVLPWLGKLRAFMIDKLGTALAGGIDLFGKLVTGIGWVVDKVEALIDALGRIDFPEPPGWLDKVPGAGGLLGAITGSTGDLVTVRHRLLGGSPSYDGRAGWSTAALGDPSWATVLQRQGAGGAGYIDARTFLTVQVDGSGVVDERRVADQLVDVLTRHAARLGRPLLTPA